MVDVVGAVVLVGVVLIIVDLHGTHVFGREHVYFKPFAGSARACRPERAHILVHGIFGDVDAVGRRRFHGLAIGQEHPSGMTRPGVGNVAVGIERGIVAESRRGIHHAIGVESRRIEAYATLKLIFVRQHAGRHMPVIALLVAECAAVARAAHISSGLVAHRVVTLVGKRSKRRVGHIHSVGIGLELSAGRAILQVVAAVVLGHCRAFGKGRQGGGVVVVHAEAFPSVLVGVKHEQVVNFGDGVKIVAAHFHAFERIFVGRSVVEIKAAVVVEE